MSLRIDKTQIRSLKRGWKLKTVGTRGREMGLGNTAVWKVRGRKKWKTHATVSLSAFLNASGSSVPSTQVTLSGKTSLTEKGNSIGTNSKMRAGALRFELERSKTTQTQTQQQAGRQFELLERTHLPVRLPVVPLCTAPAHYTALYGKQCVKPKTQSGKRRKGWAGPKSKYIPRCKFISHPCTTRRIVRGREPNGI